MTKKELIEILNQLNDDDTVSVAVFTEHCAKVHPIFKNKTSILGQVVTSYQTRDL